MKGEEQAALERGSAFVRQTLDGMKASRLPPNTELHGMPAYVLALVIEHRAAITAYLGTGKRSGTPSKVRIPKLTISNIPRFIPAVSRALERQQVSSKEANALLYAAQMLVAAYRALGDADQTAPPAKRIGFIRAAAAAIQREVPACQQH